MLRNPSDLNVTCPRTLEMMSLFDESYETMLMLLLRFYARVDSGNQQDSLKPLASAFLPMMSMVMRTMGELLTMEPAGTNESVRAGGAFILGRGVSILMHERSSFLIFQERLASISQRLERLAEDDKSGKIGEISANLDRIAGSLGDAARALEH